MKIKVNRPAGIKLSGLLSRRKTNLTSFLESQGITTYELLVERCNRMGVEPPELKDFERHKPQQASSPTEGIVIVNPPPVFLESSGEEVEDLEVQAVSDPYPPVKSGKRKKK